MTDLIHRNTFLREVSAPQVERHVSETRFQYHQFCENPSDTPIVWLGLLACILSLSATWFECEKSGSLDWKENSYRLSHDCHRVASHCLDETDLTNPVTGTVEFLSLLLHSSYFQDQESSPRIWLLTGDTVRIAMRMGYHRDPSAYDNRFSPFECEMRRRVWLFVAHTDLLFSFQLGLPTIVRRNEYDTRFPGNYYEDQLYPEMKDLPEPEPLSTPTFIGYIIANSQVLQPFRTIVEELNTVVPIPYSRIVELGHQLTEGHASICPLLRHDGADSMVTTDKGIALKRIQLLQFYLKVTCVLHRRYIIAGLRNPEYSPSTEAAIDAALGLLECQQNLHEKEQLCFQQVRWSNFTLTNHDFVLAATILCLFLSALDKLGSSAQTSRFSDRTRVYGALNSSLGIWREVRSKSSEAAKACTIVEKMVCSKPLSPVNPTENGPFHVSVFLFSNWANASKTPQRYQQ